MSKSIPDGRRGSIISALFAQWRKRGQERLLSTEDELEFILMASSKPWMCSDPLLTKVSCKLPWCPTPLQRLPHSLQSLISLVLRAPIPSPLGVTSHPLSQAPAVQRDTLCASCLALVQLVTLCVCVHARACMCVFTCSLPVCCSFCC